MLPTLLIADDDKSLHPVLKRMLKDTPYKLRSAYNGEETLAAIQANPPDIVLLDMNMPDKSGLEVLRELRSNPATAKLCVILVSGDPAVTHQPHGLPLQIQDCLSKPFDKSELEGRLSRALRHSEEISPHDYPVLSPLESKLTELTRLTTQRTLWVNKAIGTLHTRLQRLEQEPRGTPGKSAPPAARPYIAMALMGAALAAIAGGLFFRSPPSEAPAPMQASFAPALPAPIPAAVPKPPPPAAARTRPAKTAKRRQRAAPRVPTGPTLEAIRRQHFRVTLQTNSRVPGQIWFNPQRVALVLDLPGTQSGLGRRNLPGIGKLIRGVRVDPVKVGPASGTRVSIDLARPVNYKIKQAGKKILVDFYYGGRVLQ